MRRPKPKKVSYQLIPREGEIGLHMYAMLDDLVTKHHEELRDARIAIAWNVAWKADVDGRVKLGMAKKASDLDRELAPFDVVILLRRSWWRDPEVTFAQRVALLDHELTHVTLKLDPQTLEPVEDERGRKVYRIRKHDLEEFTEVVARHGMWTTDLERMAAAMRKQALAPFKPCEQCRDTPGYTATVDGTGTRRLARCSCYRRWEELRAEAKAEQQALM